MGLIIPEEVKFVMVVFCRKHYLTQEKNNKAQEFYTVDINLSLVHNNFLLMQRFSHVCHIMNIMNVKDAVTF